MLGITIYEHIFLYQIYIWSNQSKTMFKVLQSLLYMSVLVICMVHVETTTQKKSVEITKGINGLEKVILHGTYNSSVEVYLYGAHLTSWKNKQGEELIFVSSKAMFQPPKPIRGGIPIIFPQFSDLGSLPSHGFVRNRFWTIDNDQQNVTNGVFVDLLLKSTEEDLKIWPHRFEYRLRFTLSPIGDLILTSRIRNTDTDGNPFTFMSVYHTYFSVPDISKVEVEGLEKLDYLDNLKNRTRYTDQGDAITINSEFDKIYLSTPKKIAILDHKKKRKFVIQKDGLPDAVVWNPWEMKAKTMTDFAADEYKNMICVEAAAIEKPITLNPGEEWKARLQLSAVTLKLL
ncbi:putative glucose-6-phosphate 1-epimerase [Rutidosis leptorrhynchoides]|uniref:putative glucose-6-phosphate 1-epimerase n=1 Tax=Rutidosis leptorrhynchoides TaxID=125765 RepID=UPI003A992A13